ncbi:MAG: hypothetical protein H6581_31790 [Bacteroidia bacterium]|nr:hypothetical protein [Bacteroidia bacterium]
MVDLSFTKDPDWIAEREKMWEPLAENLSEDMRKKEVEARKVYFFTGAQLENFPIADVGLLRFFPLQTPEGWDYVYEKLVRKPITFEEELNSWIFNQSSTRTPEQELAYWDYFFGPTFEPIVRSRVPVGRAGKIVEVKLSPIKVLGAILSGLSGWLRQGLYGNSPKWVSRKEFFHSLLPFVKPECFGESKDRIELKVGTLLISLMEYCKNYSPDTPINDPEHNREKFLKWFADCLEAGEGIPECVKSRWADVKSGKDLEPPKPPKRKLPG